MDSGKCFELLDVFLDSATRFGFWEVFWILGRVFDSATCFEFWEVFLDSGTVFPDEPPYSSQINERCYSCKELKISSRCHFPKHNVRGW